MITFKQYVEAIITVAPFKHQIDTAIKKRKEDQAKRLNKPKTPYQRGKESKAAGEPYNNPHSFDPKAGADVNYDHNSYRDGYHS